MRKRQGGLKQKKRGGARVCARDGERKLCVIRTRAGRKLPNAVFCGLMLVTEAVWSFSLVLMVTFSTRVAQVGSGGTGK